jgi:hypothetical protein
MDDDLARQGCSVWFEKSVRMHQARIDSEYGHEDGKLLLAMFLQGPDLLSATAHPLQSSYKSPNPFEIHSLPTADFKCSSTSSCVILIYFACSCFSTINLTSGLALTNGFPSCGGAISSHP